MTCHLTFSRNNCSLGCVFLLNTIFYEKMALFKIGRSLNVLKALRNNTAALSTAAIPEPNRKPEIKYTKVG